MIHEAYSLAAIAKRAEYLGGHLHPMASRTVFTCSLSLSEIGQSLVDESAADLEAECPDISGVCELSAGTEETMWMVAGDGCCI